MRDINDGNDFTPPEKIENTGEINLNGNSAGVSDENLGDTTARNIPTPPASGGQNFYPQNGGYDQNYNSGGYRGGPYMNGRDYEKRSNTGLIAAISVLSAIIVVGIVFLTLMFTGVLRFGGGDNSAAVVPTAAPAPTDAPAPTAAPAAPAAPAAQPENNVISRYVYVANVQNSIYFRSAPAENDGNIITEIPLGTMVGFVENVDSVFAKINYNGQIGYAKQQYLSDVQPSVNNTVSDYMYVANVKNSIYFRSSPSENDGNIICEIPLGTRVGFIENANSVFAKISYNGQTGYAKREYLSYSRPSTSSSSSGSTMTVVNVDYAIYLRSSPSESSDSNLIMEIPVGATVSYLGTANSTFYKISYGGTVGYAKQIYLSFN